MDIMEISDDRLRSFLDALEDADFEVSDWEAQFMESNMDRETFTEKQRQNVLAKMVEKYGHRLDW